MLKITTPLFFGKHGHFWYNERLSMDDQLEYAFISDVMGYFTRRPRRG